MRTIAGTAASEGSTDDAAINELRMRQCKNLAAILLVSHGVPMILAGDEIGRTQQGNNNAYCQDNEVSWVDWRMAESNAGPVALLSVDDRVPQALSLAAA